MRSAAPIASRLGAADGLDNAPGAIALRARFGVQLSGSLALRANVFAGARCAGGGFVAGRARLCTGSLRVGRRLLPFVVDRFTCSLSRFLVESPGIGWHG